jgi:septal ring factor EnvC (AmiA/AmiB activator)
MDVFAQFRGYRNVARQLEAVRLHYGEDDSNNDDNQDSSSTTQFESEPQLELRDIQIKLRSLAESNSQLQQSLSHYTSFTIPKINSEIQSIQHQLEATTQENSSRSSQLEILRKQRQARSDEIAALITQFATQHKSQSGNLLIPQAGSGRFIEVGSEVAQTVEELELYVKERENVLWEKIDGLVERLKRQSRLEVVEW